MASQLEMLMEQESGLFVPGDSPSFGSIYSDMGAAKQASADWQTLIFGGVSKLWDLELRERYSPSQNQTPRQETGNVAGSLNATAGGLVPALLIGAAVLALLFLVLRK